MLIGDSIGRVITNVVFDWQLAWMDKDGFIIKRAERQCQVVLFAFSTECFIGLGLFLMGIIFDGFNFALIMVTTKALIEPLFCLLP